MALKFCNAITVGLITFCCLFFAASADATTNCAEDVANFYKCIDRHYDQELGKIFTYHTAEAFSEKAIECLTKNGCEKPAFHKFKPTQESDEDDDEEGFIGKQLDAFVFRKILNPEWFPNARNLSCIQKTLPNFKFPIENGLPSKMDYMAKAEKDFDENEYILNDVANGENLSKELCGVGLTCFKDTREPCQKFILNLHETACTCATDETEQVVKYLVDSYSKCFWP
ncbi:Bifunctional heparan sulfate N-deacetylase/N-sulfotransferase [Trichinella spiralis]|uniref:Bifunctional heparan sulfate N-deacetylase/N-sulfotransferase n=1 Tax=Trichinella spiralis TaxID=6334 RepID=A0ABR3KSI8_TRISP